MNPVKGDQETANKPGKEKYDIVKNKKREHRVISD